MFQVIFIFPDWVLLKQIIVSSSLLCFGGKIFEKMLPGGRLISLCLGWDDKNLRARKRRRERAKGEAWVKMSRFNVISRNVNINIKISPTNIQVWEKIQQAFWRERRNLREFIEIWMDVFLRLILKDKHGNQICLPFCWF